MTRWVNSALAVAMCCTFTFMPRTGGAQGTSAAGIVGLARDASASALISASRQAASQQNTARPAAASVEYEEVRTATARFQDVSVALKEGYIRDPTNMCVTAPMEGAPTQLGAMGIHYFRPDLLGITAQAPRVAGNGTHTDFNKPGVLIYEPQANGRMALVAVENLVFADAWRATGKGPPAFGSNEYYRMIDNPATPDIDEAHGFMPHFELHMWLYRDNPNGMFAPFNPNVTCEHAGSATGAASQS